MNILQVIPTLNIGGAETMLCNLSCELKCAGHIVTVVVFYDSNSSLVERLKKNGVDIISLNKRSGFDINVLTELRKVIAKVNPDIIHTHLHVLPYVWLISGRRKIVHTLHSIASKEQSGLGKMICGWVYKNSKKCIPVSISDLVKVSLKKEYKLKKDTPVVRNGVPINEIQKKASYDFKNYINIYHVGRMIPAKNHVMMIEAIDIIRKEYSNVKLHFFGYGAEYENLKDMVEKRRLQEVVIFEGTSSTLCNDLKNGDIFLLPSEYEGLPMSLIEAFAAGLPSIATNVGGIPDVMQHGLDGIMISVNLDSLVDAIKMLIDDIKVREKIGLNAIQKSVQFSSKKMAEDYVLLYESI